MEEHPVARPQVHVKRLQLQLLDEDAAVAVGDRLRQPGRTGGEQDPQRMTERYLLELELLGGHGRVVHDLVPGLRPGLPADRLPGGSRHVDHLLEAGQQRDDLLYLGAAVVVPAAVAVAVHAEQDLRRQLPEPVADPAPAEVGGAAGPDGADAGGGQHGDHCLRDVRHAGGHPVAGADTHGAQPGRQHPDAVREVRPGQSRERRGLRLVVQGLFTGPLAAQHVLCVVKPGPGEPVGAGHGPGAEDRCRPDRGLDAAVVPDRLPEPVEVSHRPVPQRVIAGEVEPALSGEPPGERGDVGAADAIRSWRPQQVTLANLAS